MLRTLLLSAPIMHINRVLSTAIKQCLRRADFYLVFLFPCGLVIRIRNRDSTRRRRMMKVLTIYGVFTFERVTFPAARKDLGVLRGVKRAFRGVELHANTSGFDGFS